MSELRFVFLPIGLPGAGKTTLVKWLSERVEARVASRDAIRDAMFRPCSYSVDEKQAAFSAVQDAVRVNATLSVSTLVDGMCFSTNGELEQLEEIARVYGSIPIPVHCKCPITVAQARVERDQVEGAHVAEDRDVDLVDTVAERFRAIPPRVYAVDMTQDITSVGTKVLNYIRQTITQ